MRENKLQDCFTGKPEENVSVMDIFRSIHTNWSFNAEEANKVRSELEESCQTSHLFITTQENVKYHGTIRYEGERFWWAFVTSDVYNRLPKKVPYKKGKFKKCSVVGNGGILLGSKCGKFIDAADFVIRMNFANVKNYTGDVGFKTDLVTCNPSQLIKQFSNLNKGGAEKLKNYAMQQYKSARVYTTPFAYQVQRNYCFKAQDILKPANIEVVFAHSDHLSSQRRFYGTKKNIKENRVTTGLLMFTAAISSVKKFICMDSGPSRKTRMENPQLSLLRRTNACSIGPRHDSRI
ncbi:alpha-2,8-sialyltransferase 8E-like [Ptychodera flava]|uniref:alpha-2,8-sialyltransferase 8E-like n=1 Tax=Ptychodera flava TaxID=63121 RepID=UPI003969CE15